MSPKSLALALAASTTLPAATAAEKAAPPVERVVLVHGIFQTGSQFKMLRERLEKRGIQCLVPRLRPADGRDGLDVLAGHLRDEIEREFGAKKDFAVIGFSMGGLVSRYYLQNLGGADRCQKFITISSPHNGTGVAWLYPGIGASQMRPDSPFLAELKQTEKRLDGIPVVSYRTPMDLIILPATSSVWDRAENLEFPVALHPLMLWSNKVLTDVESRLLD